jgi:integrase
LDTGRVTTPYTEYKAAEAWRLKYLAEMTAGSRHVGAENCTVGDLFDLLETDHAGKSSLPATLSRLKRLRAELGKIRVVDLREAQIEGYRHDRDAANATVNRELELLRRALNLGKRATPPLVIHTPFVRMVPEKNIRTQRISHEQYKALIETLRAPERYAAIIAYHIGWRRGAILGLTWDRVDWSAKVIRPPANQAREKRVGTAPIYGDMQEALKACMAVESDCVIHRANGSKVIDIRKAWDKACLSAGLPGFRFHDFRACAVSNLVDFGVSPYDAMQISGHKTLSMLQRYDIVSTKRLAEIGRRMEERFSGIEPGRPRK